jgi:hypothetical protein
LFSFISANSQFARAGDLLNGSHPNCGALAFWVRIAVPL